jgi:hypothetical protein
MLLLLLLRLLMSLSTRGRVSTSTFDIAIRPLGIKTLMPAFGKVRSSFAVPANKE